MTSPDLTQANIDKIADLFPSVVTESVDADGNLVRSVDFDLLRQELSDHIVEGPRSATGWTGPASVPPPLPPTPPSPKPYDRSARNP